MSIMGKNTWKPSINLRSQECPDFSCVWFWDRVNVLMCHFLLELPQTCPLSPADLQIYCSQTISNILNIPSRVSAGRFLLFFLF